MLLHHRHNAQIAHNGSIDARSFHGLSVFGKSRQVFIVGVGIAGNVHTCTSAVGQLNGTRQIFQREIAGTGAQAEAVARKVHRVGPEVKRIFKLLPPAGGSK